MWQWKLTDETADVKSISRIKHNPLWTCDRVLQKIDWFYSASNCREQVYAVCTRATLFSPILWLSSSYNGSVLFFCSIFREILLLLCYPCKSVKWPVLDWLKSYIFLNTVEPSFNDIHLCDISPVTSDILQHKLIPYYFCYNVRLMHFVTSCSHLKSYNCWLHQVLKNI
jgi:hypothetical protein